MKNDELEALYEEMPWAWEVQWRHHGSKKWEPMNDVIDRIVNLSGPHFRLKPRLPADLPEPTEDMMDRAVYLGRGPIKKNGDTDCFCAYVFDGVKPWRPVRLADGVVTRYHYCIDINDPNAREIIALNRAEDDVEGWIAQPHREDLLRWQEESSQTSEANKADILYQALIELGWTPPGESAWLRLDECVIETADGFGGWDRLTPLRGERHLMALVYSIAKDGPSSVRVRKKRSDQ